MLSFLKLQQLYIFNHINSDKDFEVKIFDFLFFMKSTSKCYRKVATCKIRRIQKIIEGEEELRSSIILFVQNGIKKDGKMKVFN